MVARRNRSTGRWLMPEIPELYPERLSKYLDTLFYAPSALLSDFAKMPDVDLIDEGDHITVKADMPGVKKDDIKLKVNKSNITISAETKKEKEEKGKNYYYSERAASSYFRSIPLPTEVLPDTADAKFEDGTLEISIKKAKEEGKEVTVK
ncbi:MAG: Hsp20/alpha crystallin family protein [Candidatus Micrarchaeia archaeon]